MSQNEKHPLLSKKAPSLKVTLGDGEKHSLGELLDASEWTVLYFYPRDNTPGCTQESNDFQSMQNRLKKLGAQIIGVSADSEASHQKFIKKLNLKFPLIADTEKKLCEKFGVWQLKKFMGKEFMGIVRSTFIIKDKKIVAVWQPVKVKEHAADVLSTIKELS